MIEDVLRFRKICKILEEKFGYTRDKIATEMRVSLPTLKKLLSDPPDELKIRASMLAIVQDFCKRNKDSEYYKDVDVKQYELIDHKKKPGKKKQVLEQGKGKDLVDLVNSISEILKCMPGVVSITISSYGTASIEHK